MAVDHKFLNHDYSTPLTINSRRRTFRGETLSLKVQTNVGSAQRWDLTITLRPSVGRELSSDGANDLARHRFNHGTHTSFTMPMPQHKEVVDEVGDIDLTDIDVATAASAGDTTISMTSDHGLTLKAGMFVKFGNHEKIYMIDQDTHFSAGNTEDVFIFPELTMDLPVDTTFHGFDDTDITVYYAQDGVEGITYTDGIVARTTLNVVEALA